MKKSTIILIFIIVILFIMTSMSTNEIVMKAYNLSELEHMPLKSTYTYEETLIEMERLGLSTTQMLKLKDQVEEIKRRGKSIGISIFKLDPYEVPGTILKYTLQPYIFVGLEYGNSHLPNRIAFIENPFVYYSGINHCTFAGEIYYKLEAGNRFYYSVHGPIHRTSTLHTAEIGQVGIFESVKINLNMDYSDNYITFVNFQGRYYNSNFDI